MPATPQFSIGLDFGTNSVRALVVDVADGREIASAVAVYEHGEQGVILDPKEPDLARQHPADYLVGIEKTVREALNHATPVQGFDVSRIVGFGVDTTGSTPMPITASGDTLANDA
jgi:L-ribulokinase